MTKTSYVIIDGTTGPDAIAVVMGKNHRHKWDGPADTLPGRLITEHVAPTIKLPEGGVPLADLSYSESSGSCEIVIPADLVMGFRSHFGFSEVIMERDEEGWVVTIRHRQEAIFNPTAAKLMQSLVPTSADVETKT